MKRNFSLGSFLELFDADETTLKEKINQLDNFEGLQHVEILLEYTDQTAKTTDVLKQGLKKYRKIVHAPFVNIGLVSREQINRASLEILQQAYNWALEVGAEVFTIHAGHFPWYQPRQKTQEIFQEWLSKLQLSPDLRVGVENMPASRTPTTSTLLENLLELEAVVGPLKNFGYTLDIGHVIQNKEPDWQNWIARNCARINNIHLHDATLGGKGHLALGTADLPLAQLLAHLSAVGYERFLTLEVVGEQAIHDSWQYLQKM